MSTEIYSSNYLRLGKGTLLGKRSDATVVSFFSFGDCENISFTPDIQKEEAYSNEAGPQVVIDTTIKAIKYTANVTCRNINAVNLSLYFMASEVTSFTEASATMPITAFVVNVGEFVDLGHLGCSSIVVSSDTPQTDLHVEDTDYQVVHDGDHGFIKILGGDISNGSTIYVSAAVDNSTVYSQIKTATSTTINCHFTYLGNPIKGARKKSLFYGTIEPTGDYSLVGDTYTNIGFIITLLDIHTSNSRYDSIMDHYILDMVS